MIHTEFDGDANFSRFELKKLFLTNLLQKIKIVCLRWNMVALSVTKIVRLAHPVPLFKVGCKFACSFLVSTAWHRFFRLGTTLSQGNGGILVFLSKSNIFLGLFYKNIASHNNFYHWLPQNWWIRVEIVILFKLVKEGWRSIWQTSLWYTKILPWCFTYLWWYLVIEVFGWGIFRSDIGTYFKLHLKR